MAFDYIPDVESKPIFTLNDISFWSVKHIKQTKLFVTLEDSSSLVTGNITSGKIKGTHVSW